MGTYWDLSDDDEDDDDEQQQVLQRTAVAPAPAPASADTAGAYDYAQGYATREAADYAQQQQQAAALEQQQLQQQQQQAEAARQPRETQVQRIKGKDFFGQANVPAADNSAPIPPADAGETGAPPPRDQPQTGAGYDAFLMQRTSVPRTPGAGDSANLADPYASVPVSSDAQANRDRAAAQTATALGQQARLEAGDVREGLRDLQARQTQFRAKFPGLETAPDEAAARQAIDATFNQQYAEPVANVRQGWFNTGELTDSAQKFRAQIDQQKATAHAEYTDLTQRSRALDAQRQAAEARAAQARTLQEQVLARQLEQARAAGVEIPEIAQPAAVEAQSPAGDKAALQPFSPGGPAFHRAEDGVVTFDPLRLSKGLREAYAARAIDQETLQRLAPLAREAQQALIEQSAMLADDSVASKLKAMGVGATKGAAFMAGAPVGAGIGAEIGALGGPLAPFTVPAGAAIGGMITGGLASYAADKILKKFAQHSETVKSFTDAADAHPYYDAAGNLIAFGAGLPKAGMQAAGRFIAGEAGVGAKTTSTLLTEQLAAARAAGVRPPVNLSAVAKAALNPSNLRQSIANATANSGAGVVDTVRNLAEDAALRSAQGATTAQIAGALGTRVGGYAAGNVAIDTVIKEGAKALGFSQEGQTIPGTVQAALMGAFMSGHGITFKDYSAQEVGTILTKAREATARGLDPRTVLTRAEYEVGTAAAAEIQRRVNSGKASATDTITARQALNRGQSYGVTAAQTAERPLAIGPGQTATLPIAPQLTGPAETAPAAGQTPRQLTAGSSPLALPAPEGRPSGTGAPSAVTLPTESGGKLGYETRPATTLQRPTSAALPDVATIQSVVPEHTAPAPAAPSTAPQPGKANPSITPAETAAQTELAARQQELAALSADTPPWQRNLVSHRIAALQSQTLSPAAPAPALAAPRPAQPIVPAAPAPITRDRVPLANAGAEPLAGPTQNPSASTTVPSPSPAPSAVPPASRAVYQESPRGAGGETAPASQPRAWGDVSGADVGAPVMTADGRQGTVTEVGNLVVKFRDSNGLLTGTKKATARIAPPQTLPLTPANTATGSSPQASGEVNGNLALANNPTYEKSSYEAAQTTAQPGQELSGYQSGSRTAASAARHAGEPGGKGGDYAPAAGSLDTLGRFAGSDQEIADHLQRLGIRQERVPLEKAPGGMVLYPTGVLGWSLEGLINRLLHSPPHLRRASLHTAALEEMIHWAHRLVDPHNLVRSGVRWMRLGKSDGKMQELVRAAYRTGKNASHWGEEYLRMLVQVRNGFPLSEEFFRDTRELREALMRRQSPEVEAVVLKVTEMLLHGKGPATVDNSTVYGVDEAFFAEPMDEAGKTGAKAKVRVEGFPAGKTDREWGDVHPVNDIGAMVTTKGGRSGQVEWVGKRVVKFRQADGKLEAAHIDNTRLLPSAESQPSKPDEKGQSTNSQAAEELYASSPDGPDAASDAEDDWAAYERYLKDAEADPDRANREVDEYFARKDAKIKAARLKAQKRWPNIGGAYLPPTFRTREEILATPSKVELDFVILDDGKLLIGTSHGGMAEGKEVVAAGQVTFMDGDLRLIINASGHYRPTVLDAEFVESVFTDEGFNARGRYDTTVKYK